MLILKAWYGLSDPEFEKQVNDRISFLKFLNFPENVPDKATIND
jgi:IS5 family transposase